MTDFKKIIKGFFWNYLGRISEYLLIYLFTVLIARSLGAVVNGYYATFISITQLLLILSSLGLETAITSRLPQQPTDKSIWAKVLINLLLIRLLVVGLVGFLFLFLWNDVSSLLNIPNEIANYLIIIVFYFGFRSITSLLTIFLIVSYDTKKISLVNVTLRLIELLFAYLFIQSGLGLREILILISITAVIGITIYIYLLRELLFTQENRRCMFKDVSVVLKPFINLGSMLWLIGLFDFIISKQADIFLLNYFIGKADIIGQYDVATSFGQILNVGLTTGMYGISVVSFSELSKSKPALLPNYCEFLSRMIVIIVVPAFVFAIFFAERLITLIYSEIYIPSIFLFQIFAFFLLVTRVMSGGVTGDFLLSKGYWKILFTASLSGGIVNLILALILIPKYSAIGAIYATGIGLLTITLVHGLYVNRLLKINFPITFSLKLIGMSILALIFTIIAQRLIFIDNIIVTLTIYAFVFWFLLVLTKPLKYEELKFIELNSINMFAKLPVELSKLTDRQKWAFAWMPISDVTVDIGSSVSPLLDVISLKSKTVIAVDVDFEAIQQTKILYPNIHVTCESATKMSLKSELCDTVLLLDVLEHIEDEAKVANEIWRILKPGGKLIISVPNKGLFRFLDPLNLKKNNKKGNTHRHYSEKEILNLFNTKFKLVKKHYGGLFIYPLTFAANNFFHKHFNLKWDSFFKRLGDWDNDISWGKLSYNIILMLEKVRK